MGGRGLKTIMVASALVLVACIFLMQNLASYALNPMVYQFLAYVPVLGGLSLLVLILSIIAYIFKYA
ncbi:MAG: hypothetical protein ABC527_06140 [Candidatus Methanosuratincola petrocarbonis]